MTPSSIDHTGGTILTSKTALVAVGILFACFGISPLCESDVNAVTAPVVRHFAPVTHPAGVKQAEAANTRATTSAQFPEPTPATPLNWKVIWSILASEIVLLGILLFGLARWPDQKIDFLVHYWGLCQTIGIVLLVLLSQFDLLVSRLYWPVGAVIAIIALSGMTITCFNINSRRRRITAVELGPALQSFDLLSSMLRPVVFFTIIPAIIAADPPILATVLPITLVIMCAHRLMDESNARTKLRLQIEPQGTQVLDERLTALRSAMAPYCARCTVEMMDNPVSDKRIFAKSHLGRRISVSVAALQQLTAEQLLMLAVMQTKHSFILYARLTLSVAFVLCLAVFDNLLMWCLDHILLLLLVLWLSSELYNRYGYTRADRQAIGRLGMVLPAGELLELQKSQASEPSCGFLDPFELRLSAIRKRQEHLADV